MKTLNIITLLMLLSASVFGQSKRYVETMEKTISSLYQAQSLEEFDPITNQLTRIGEAEKVHWEPYYYAAQAQVLKSFRIEDLPAKDMVLDQALEHVKKGHEVMADNVELITMEGLIYMLKVVVDPGTRGQTLSPKVMGSFSKALQLDPENPRAMLFMGQMRFGTAQFFGTGVEEPCKMIMKSIELFDKEQPATKLSPTWGKDGVKQYVEACRIEN